MSYCIANVGYTGTLDEFKVKMMDNLKSDPTFSCLTINVIESTCFYLGKYPTPPEGQTTALLFITYNPHRTDMYDACKYIDQFINLFTKDKGGENVVVPRYYTSFTLQPPPKE